MTEEVPTSKATHFEPLSLFWRLLATPQILMALLGLLALALALGTLIPQIPPQVADDPQAWLAAQPGILSKDSGLILALGFFDVYRAFWFHALLALTGLVLFVQCVESAELAWRATRRERWTRASFASWERHALQIRASSVLSVDETLAQLHDLLRRQGYHWTEEPAQPAANLVAGRWERTLWAQPAIWGALLVVLLGLTIVGGWGWQDEDWQPIPGENRAAGHGTPYAVRLEALTPPQGEAGSLCNYRSQIAWLEGEAVVSLDTVSNRRPARFHGIAVRQVGQVPAVKLRGQDEAGRPLVFQAEGAELFPVSNIELNFPTLDLQQLVYIPSHDLFLSLTFESPSSRDKPVLHVARQRSGSAERQLVAVLSESGAVDVDNIEVLVDVEYRPILRLDYRPAMPLPLGGIALALIALAIAWLAPPGLLWGTVEPGEEGSVLLQIFALPGARGSQWLSQLSDHLQEVLADGI